MNTAVWMTWRELTARKGWTLAGVLAVASAVALCSTLEILSRSREEAVAARTDQMGPPLKVVPAGITSRDLARFDMKDRYFSTKTLLQIQDDLGSDVRAIEGRLFVRGFMNGRLVPFVGVDPSRVSSPFAALGGLEGEDVALGSVLASDLPAGPGDILSFKGSRLRVAAVLPSNGGPEDLAVFTTLERLQSLFERQGMLNVIRVFPRQLDKLGAIEARIGARVDNVSLIAPRDPRGADHEIGVVLAGHRWALYAASAAVVALCILIWSYLRALAGRLEIASIAAMGGSAIFLITVLAMPATLLGLFGALIGYLAAVAIALSVDFGSAAPVAFSGSLFLTIALFTIGPAFVGSLPIAVRFAVREHVGTLQE
ncbi:MAG: hypothetical protein GXP54_01525 [Deltaproteobacteria bacterium]|nr:hypothetical protein [Deltaproteobacteria bacterium]